MTPCHTQALQSSREQWQVKVWPLVRLSSTEYPCRAPVKCGDEVWRNGKAVKGKAHKKGLEELWQYVVTVIL